MMPKKDPYAATAIQAADDPYAATAIQAADDPYAATAVQTGPTRLESVDENPPPPPGLRVPTMRERFLNPEYYPVGLKGEGVGENLKNLAQRGGVGIFQLANAAMTPRQTAAGLLSSVLPDPVVRLANRAVDLENKIPGMHYLTTKLPEGTPNPLKQAYDALAPGGWQAAGNVAPIAGQALVGEAFGVAVPEIKADIRSGVESTGRALTNTGNRPVLDLVRSTQLENEKIGAVNADRIKAFEKAQADAAADHRANLLKLRQKYAQDVRDATEKARTGTAEDRAQYQSKQLAAKQKYEQQVRDAQAAYEQKKAAAEKANAEAQRAYNQKIGQTVQKNRTVAATEKARADATAQTMVYGSQLIYRLNKLDRALRDRANAMYDAIREKVGNASQPGSALSAAAQDAMKNIKGTSETPKIFRDILGKYPAEEPNFIEYKGAQIPKGTPLYDVLKEHGAVASPPVTFANLQGYYSELGAELSEGTLPGDVYLATKALQESVADIMQKMAKDAGVEKQLIAARKFYRNYMDTFHEPAGPSASGSPIAQALLAKDPSIAVQKFSGASGDRGIVDLRKYDSNLADLAQQARNVKRGAPTGKIPARTSISSVPAPKQTPVPAGPSLPLPPVLEKTPAPRAANLPLPSVLPEAKTVPLELKPGRMISSADIQRARDAYNQSRVNWVNRRGAWVATWPVFEAIRALWGGHIPWIPAMGIESAGTFAMVRATSAMMQYPPMLRFLTQARPEDVALIPPELRGNLPGLVTIARRQGIKVAPALIAAVSGQGQQQPQSIPPAQAMHAVLSGAGGTQ